MYDMAAELGQCRDDRLRENAAREIQQRISKMDPSKDSSGRVAMVPIDSRRVGVPRELRRVASYTSMYVLGSGSQQRARSRWNTVRHALAWMIAHWRAQKLGLTISEAKLNTRETDLIAPFANLIKVGPHFPRFCIGTVSLDTETLKYSRRRGSWGFTRPAHPLP